MEKVSIQIVFHLTINVSFVRLEYMKNYLSWLYKGRINRRTYILGIIIYISITYLSGYFLSRQFIIKILQQYPLLYIVFVPYVIVMLFWIGLLYTRRLNDISNDEIKKIEEIKKEKYWNPGNTLDYLALTAFFLKGQDEENKYGKPPEPKIDFKGLFGF